MKSNALASLLTGAIIVVALTAGWVFLRYFFALRDLRGRWMFQPVELRSDQESIVKKVAHKLSESSLLPSSERNDAFILAEAALLDCMLLVSHDSHLYEVDHGKLKRLLAEFDLNAPVIASPREIVKKFYR